MRLSQVTYNEYSEILIVFIPSSREQLLFFQQIGEHPFPVDKSCQLAQRSHFLFPAGEIAPSPPLLYFLVPLTIGFDILVYPRWHCSLGSDDLNYCFFLQHGSNVPLGPRVKMDSYESGWLEKHVTEGLLVQLVSADSVCLGIGCAPFSLSCSQSLLP